MATVVSGQSIFSSQTGKISMAGSESPETKMPDPKPKQTFTNENFCSQGFDSTMITEEIKNPDAGIQDRGVISASAGKSTGFQFGKVNPSTASKTP